MSKKELRTRLLNDTLAYALQGNKIEVLPPQNVRTKSVCRAKSSNTVIRGGSMPQFKISNTFRVD
jgi:hypothetical protein